MAQINEVNVNTKQITFDCLSEEFEDLSISSEYFLIKDEFTDECKFIKRGKNDATMYLRIPKHVKEYLLDEHSKEFKKKGFNSRCKTFEHHDKKFLLVEL